MNSFIVLACLAAAVYGTEDYFTRYGHNKVMVGCFGPYVYQEQLKAIVAAEAECMGTKFSMDDIPTDAGPAAEAPHGLSKREAEADAEPGVVLPGAYGDAGLHGIAGVHGLHAGVHGLHAGLHGAAYGGDLLHAGVHAHGVHAHGVHAHGVHAHSLVHDHGYAGDLHGHGGVHGLHGFHGFGGHLLTSGFLGDASQLSKTLATLDGAIGNFTCVLKKLNIVDDDLNIYYQTIINNIYGNIIDPYLKQDLLAGIYQCSYAAQCQPEDRVGSAYPYKLQRLLAFTKCERQNRLTACLKQDLRYSLKNFDLTGLPDDNGRTGEVEKLVTVLVGAETTEDLRFY